MTNRGDNQKEHVNLPTREMSAVALGNIVASPVIGGNPLWPAPRPPRGNVVDSPVTPRVTARQPCHSQERALEGAMNLHGVDHVVGTSRVVATTRSK